MPVSLRCACLHCRSSSTVSMTCCGRSMHSALEDPLDVYEGSNCEEHQCTPQASNSPSSCRNRISRSSRRKLFSLQTHVLHVLTHIQHVAGQLFSAYTFPILQFVPWQLLFPDTGPQQRQYGQTQCGIYRRRI